MSKRIGQTVAPIAHDEAGEYRPALVTDRMADERDDAAIVVHYADAIMGATDASERARLWAEVQSEHPGHLDAIAERACGIPATVRPEYTRPCASVGNLTIVSLDAILDASAWDWEDRRPGVTPSPSVLDVMADAMNAVRASLVGPDVAIVAAWIDGPARESLVSLARRAGVVGADVRTLDADTRRAVDATVGRFVDAVAAELVARVRDRAPIGRVRTPRERETYTRTPNQIRRDDYARDYGRAGRRDLLGSSRDMIGGYPWAGESSATVAPIAEDVRRAIESPAARERASATYRAAMAAGFGTAPVPLADKWRARGMVADEARERAARERLTSAPTVAPTNARAAALALLG